MWLIQYSKNIFSTIGSRILRHQEITPLRYEVFIEKSKLLTTTITEQMNIL